MGTHVCNVCEYRNYCSTIILDFDAECPPERFEQAKKNKPIILKLREEFLKKKQERHQEKMKRFDEKYSNLRKG